MKRSSNSQSDAADSDNLITNHKKQKVEVKQESKQDVIEERENDVDDNDKVSNIPVESSMTRKKCPYLDTVCRQKLDFDQQKVCSVTLTNLNVYACLVCGKYFHGKRKDTPAYIHSVQMGHFVFINLQDTRTVCLPDGYEVIDAALNDVKSCLSPKYDAETITHLSSNVTLARDVYGVSYLPGFVGLNNLSRTDYINVILHALSHVAPLRDFCLQDPLPGTDMRSSELYKYPVLKTFVEIVRKMWSSSNFKSVISPAEFVHALSTRSERRFAVGKRMEVSELFNWLIQEFHRNMLGIHKDNRGKIGSKAKEPFKSIMHDIFQGEVEVKTVEGAGNEPDSMEPSDMKAQRMPFNMLSLDIPAAPLFRNSQGATVIPQVPLQELLRKFDGRSWTDKVTETGPCRKQYVIRRLPRFLVLHLARFASSGLGGQTGEKNATIVTFPVKNLEMKEYLQLDQTSTFPLPNAETINGMSIAQLRDTVVKFGSADLRKEEISALEKIHLQDIARRSLSHTQLRSTGTKYDLVANICHDIHTAQTITSGLTTNTAINSKGSGLTSGGVLGTNTLSDGTYRVHVSNNGQWFEIQDLHVSETMPQVVALSESNLLIYERQT